MSSEIVIQPWSANEYSNLALVQEVKKHPCLYNNTIPEYSQKEVTGRVWAEIAEKFGCSVSLLRKKWKNLRTSYSRYLKNTATRKKRKDWYMAKKMEFLNPYMECCKSVTSKDNEAAMYLLSFEEAENADSTDPASSMQFQSDIGGVAISHVRTCLKKEPDEDDMTLSAESGGENSETDVTERAGAINQFHSQDEPDEDNNAARSAVNFDGQFRKIASKPTEKKIAFLDSELHNKVNESNLTMTRMPTIIQCVKAAEDPARKVQPVIENPRRQFILSLLPEVNGMSETQFYKFKRKLFQLVDDLMVEE